MKILRRFAPGVVVAIAALAAMPAAAQEGPEITVTVTALGKGNAAPPAIAKEDVVVRQSGKVQTVTGWEAAKEAKAGLELMIVVDDSLNSNLGLQFGDLTNFINGLPEGSRVGVAYALNGVARMQQNLTTDHAAAAKALRLPMGRAGAYAGVFLAVTDLAKRWPSSNNRREILLISNGIDLLRGVQDSSPALNTDLKVAIDETQRRGIVVFTIYSEGVGHLRRNFYLVSNGQGCLGRLAAQTGGDSYFQGMGSPVSFQPMLGEMSRALGEQYLLTFQAAAQAKSGYARLQVTTEQKDVEILAPDRVYVPAGTR